TLLKVISGILKPSGGIVRVNGRVAALIELGAGFHPEITGRENIVINGIMLGLTRREIDQRFDSIVEFSGIGDFIDQPVKTYSAGMYVRLGFAVAVHVNPDVLLIDEVLAVGDEEFSAKCIAKIQEMKYRGVTLVFVTHQLDQVRNLCDRALWLDHGEAEAVGDPVRVVDAYLQDVAGAPASPPAGPEPSSAPASDKPRDEEERWGSGEVVLSRVALADDKGRELVAVGPGSPVAIEMDVAVRVPQDDFVFGIGIYHADGTCVYGTNTDLEGLAAGAPKTQVLSHPPDPPRSGLKQPETLSSSPALSEAGGSTHGRTQRRFRIRRHHRRPGQPPGELHLRFSDEAGRHTGHRP